MEKHNAITLKNISFQFSPEKPFFFKDLSLDFPAGAIHFIRGKNGMGKSLFFRILQGKFLKNEVVSGSFIITGQISMVQQKFDQMLASMFSFTENLRLANMPEIPDLSLLPSHKPLPDFLNKFAIDMTKPVNQLSGGQRQILAIIMALQKAGTILLLDEPTAALDQQNAALVMDFVSDLVKTTGITILIISHDNDLVAQYAHHGYYELVLDQETGLRKIIKT